MCVLGGRVLKKPKVVLSFKKRLDLAFGGWPRSGPEVPIEKKANLFLCDYFQDFPSGEFENKLTKPPLPSLGLF